MSRVAGHSLLTRLQQFIADGQETITMNCCMSIIIIYTISQSYTLYTYTVYNRHTGIYITGQQIYIRYGIYRYTVYRLTGIRYIISNIIINKGIQE